MPSRRLSVTHADTTLSLVSHPFCGRLFGCFQLMLLLVSVFLPSAFINAQINAQYEPDSIIIKGGTPLQLAAVNTTNGITIRRVFTNLAGIRVLQLPPGLAVSVALERYRKHPFIEYAEPNYAQYLAAAPNDPKFTDGTLWNLHNITTDVDIDAPEAWSTRSAANDVVVAVIDSGIDLSHQDLIGNLWTNPGEIAGNGLDDDGNGYVDDIHGATMVPPNMGNFNNVLDESGHGTHVAGIIGAMGNNALGVSGVAWNVKLMPLKVYYGYDSNGTIEWFLSAVDYAIKMGANIVNFSGTHIMAYSMSVMNSIGQLRDRGIPFVAAADNYSLNTDINKRYPACYDIDNVIAVAATTRSDELAAYSNYGKNWIHVAAPGGGGVEAPETDRIYSTYGNVLINNSYHYLAGTSMATPHVSGALALLMAQYPGEDYLQLKHRIMAGADGLVSLAGKCQTAGRLNLNIALTGSTSQPHNDSFSKALAIEYASSSDGIHLVGDNVGATKEAGEPNHAGILGGTSVWWKWTPQATSQSPLPAVQIRTSGSGFDTVLAVYRGSSVGTLIPVASSDFGGQNNSSVLEFTPQIEQGSSYYTYYIAVDGKNGAVGTIKLRLRSLLAAQLSETRFNPNMTLRTPGQFRVSVLYPTGFPLVIEKATSFRDGWGTVIVNLAGSGNYTYVDNNALQGSAFYRARSGSFSYPTPAPEVSTWNMTGYAERTVPQGWSMHAAPFRTASATLSSVIAGITEGTSAYKWNESTQSWLGNTFSDGVWDDPSWTLLPGEGIALFNPGNSYTITFVGEVVAGYTATPLPAGVCVRSSMVPEAGKLATYLRFPVATGNKVHKMNLNGTWNTYTFNGSSGWSPHEPMLAVGESFMSEKATANTWRRNIMPWP